MVCRDLKNFGQSGKIFKRTADEILGKVCIYLWKRHALCYAVLGYARNRWLNTLYGIVWETKYGRFTTLNIPKCEHFTLLVCPLRFLVISAMRRLGNVQSFKTYVFRFWAFCYESDPGYAGYPTLGLLNICRISYDKRVIELISVYQRGKNYLFCNSGILKF